MAEEDYIYEIDKVATNDLFRMAGMLRKDTDAFEDKSNAYVAAHILESILLDWAFKDSTMIEDLFIEMDAMNDGMLRTFCRKILDRLVKSSVDDYPILNNTKLAIIQDYHASDKDFLPDDRFFNQTVLNAKRGYFKITLN